jgi:hypothetical protein
LFIAAPDDCVINHVTCAEERQFPTRDVRRRYAEGELAKLTEPYPPAFQVTSGDRGDAATGEPQRDERPDISL